jgi:chromosome partitioning protein
MNTSVQSSTESADVLTEDERHRLRRVVVLANGKGGCGKTTLTVELAGFLAAADFKVLIVDLDPQGNAGINLGYTARGLSDEGAALFLAVTSNSAPIPIKNVRPGLDVLAGGDATADLADLILGRARRNDSSRGGVAKALAKIAPFYDVILIDTPPLYPGLLDEALLAARWAVIPTRPNEKDIQGLIKLDAQISRVRPYNSTLEILGVVLFGIPTVGAGKSSRVEAGARQILSELLGDMIPTFTTTIRNVVAADSDGSARGQLASELADDSTKDAPWWKYLRGETGERPIARSSTSLAGDHFALATEIFDELKAHEDRQEAPAVTSGDTDV